MKQFILAIFITAGLLACSNYGKKVSKDYLEVYYKDGATKEDAQKTLDLLYPLWKSTEGKSASKSIQLTKTGDTINFRMVIDKDKLSQIEDETFYTMSQLFSDSLFSGKPVNMVLTDNKLKAIRTLVYKKMETENDWGEKVTAGNIEVYCKDGFSKKEAQALANFLEKDMGSPASIISFQVAKDKDQFIFVRMVSSEEKAASIDAAVFNEMAASISDNVFNGEHVMFELTDNKFNAFKTFHSNPK